MLLHASKKPQTNRFERRMTSKSPPGGSLLGLTASMARSSKRSKRSKRSSLQVATADVQAGSWKVFQAVQGPLDQGYFIAIFAGESTPGRGGSEPDCSTIQVRYPR